MSHMQFTFRDSSGKSKICKTIPNCQRTWDSITKSDIKYIHRYENDGVICVDIEYV